MVVAAVGTQSQFVANHAEEFVLLLGLTCTLLLSWLSFRFFESAFINLKERWTIPEHGSALNPES
jgi:peptidoglycan/LPS O-acetylase OafA/YrhL